MHFNISHRIAGMDVATFERLYFDEAFNEAMCQALGLGRKLVRLDSRGDRIVREVEVTPERQMPAMMRKVLGDQAIAYTESLEYTLGSGQGVWRTVSNLMADKITSDGELVIKAAAEGGVERRVVGHVTVKIFGLGKAIEKLIAADVADSYLRAARFAESYRV